MVILLLYFILGIIFGILGINILTCVSDLFTNFINLLIAKMAVKAAQYQQEITPQEETITRAIGFSYEEPTEEEYDEDI